MTLLLMEGFENVVDSGNNATPLQLGNWSGSSVAVNTANGRLGGLGVIPIGSTISPLIPPLTEIIIGCAVKIPDISVNGASNYIFYLVGDGTSTGHLSVTTTAGGALQIRRGNGTATVIATSPTGLIQSGVWGYVEFRATIADAGGKAIVRWNGVEAINFTGDTKNGGTNTTIDMTYFGGGNIHCYDDIYIIDPTTGSAPYNDFLGDVRIQSIFPNGNGSFSQGTGSDADSVDNYALIDEARAASTTDYVDLSTGEKDTYSYQDTTLPATSTIYAVQAVTHAQKTDTGFITTADVARLGANESVGTASVPGTSAEIKRTIWTSKPGGGAWTVTDVNNAEFGVTAS